MEDNIKEYRTDMDLLYACWIGICPFLCPTPMTADLTMCVTYFEVGRMIVEEEQGGKARAEYGKGLLVGLSAFLNERVGKVFSESTLRNARIFYQVYAPSIQQTLFAESQKGQPLSAQLKSS